MALEHMTVLPPPANLSELNTLWRKAIESELTNTGEK